MVTSVLWYTIYLSVSFVLLKDVPSCLCPFQGSLANIVLEYDMNVIVEMHFSNGCLYYHIISGVSLYFATWH